MPACWAISAGPTSRARRTRARSIPASRPGRVNSGTERGDIDVPADPQRIVVLSGDQLDALCALGLQSRIVAAALPDGSPSQPSYLGTVIHDVPARRHPQHARPGRASPPPAPT